MKKYEDNWYLLIKTDKKKKKTVSNLLALPLTQASPNLCFSFESFKKRQTSKTSATKIFLKGANK
jgi:hypothetical protein